LPDILINTQGVAFKEYDPDQDQIHALPVITGLNLTFSNNRHHFKGPLFNSVFDLLHGEYADTIISINGDENTGITIQVPDIFNQKPMAKNQHVPIRLGFDNYGKKLIRARQISQYIFANIPGKTICAMDLFDIDTVFIKTADMDALHTYIEKGV
ncbi:MAG: TetR family transcriptional regulator, partial [Desulfotignum sp.]|nr:TetR family transcriptional regulator [Desulfotignum sp.]